MKRKTSSLGIFAKVLLLNLKIFLNVIDIHWDFKRLMDSRLHGNDIDVSGNDIDVSGNDIDASGNDIDASGNDIDANGNDFIN